MFPFHRGKTILALSLFSATLLVSPTWALPVVNPGFDVDPLADGNNTCNGVSGFTGWNSLGGGCGTGLFNPQAGQYPGGTVPSGDNVAYLNGNVGYWQALGSTWQPNDTVTFALLVGQRLDEPFGGYTLELRAGSDYDTSTLLQSFSSLVSPGAGLFGPTSVTHSTGGFDAAIGQQILVAFRGQGVQTNFDSVTVESTATPEPGTYGLLGTALVGLALVRRRQTNQ